MTAVTRVRLLIAAIWCGSLLVVLSVFSYLSVSDAIEYDKYKTALAASSSAYAPYVGALLAFYFAKRPGTVRSNLPAAALGAGGAILFNAVILLRVVLLVFGKGTIDDALDLLQHNGLNWIVAPAMGFYFGREEA
jgi:hypothetical protein